MDSLYDRALLEIGKDGTFQKEFDFTYNFILQLLWTMAYNNIILALTITPHTCKLPEKSDNNISDYLWKLQHIPSTVNFNKNKTFSSCFIYADHDANDTAACDNYDYDKTWYETTVPSENNWVCDKDLYVPNIFAYSRIGEIIGSFVFGWFGDKYGRKLTYMISLAFLLIGRVISVFSGHSFLLFTIGCIVASFPSSCAVQSTAIISIEISSPKRRSILAKLRLVSASLGMCLMPFLYWWLRDWKPFLIVTVVTLLPYIVLSWKIIESPQWLWINRKTKACVEQLKYIATVNKTILDSETEKELIAAPLSRKEEVLGLLALFSGWKLSINTILQLCIWISVSSNYTLILMASAEKSNGNPFLEFAWQSLAEMPGYFLGALLADRIGRRYTGATSSTVTAILWTLLSVREFSILPAWIRSGWMGTTLITINKLALSVSYYNINLFNMELYPTCLRQSGMSLGNAFSSGASATAAYILNMGHTYDARLPGGILAAVSLLAGAICSLCLPETLNVKLPESLDDARNFGQRDEQYISTDLN